MTCTEVNRGPQTGREVTYYIGVSHFPFERAAKHEARNDENGGEDQIERELDIIQLSLGFE